MSLEKYTIGYIIFLSISSGYISKKKMGEQRNNGHVCCLTLYILFLMLYCLFLPPALPCGVYVKFSLIELKTRFYFYSSGCYS